MMSQSRMNPTKKSVAKKIKIGELNKLDCKQYMEVKHNVRDIFEGKNIFKTAQ